VVSRIVEIIRRVVLEELARNRGSLLGVVTTVYPHETEDDENNYEANVRLKHEDLELRRVPIAVGHVGVAAPPRAGDLVLVQFLNGDSNQPLVTGRFYHADERPPLHKEDEILIEQRVSDDTLNHLRFASDGSIFLQRDVTKPEDNSEAKASIKVDGASGDIEIKAADTIVILMKNDGEIQVTAEDKPISVTASKMTIDGDVDINGNLKVASSSGSTTISGHEITGA
jgi:phage baseplate assembly protein gpV